MASAQTNFDTAQAEVDRLTRGPDPAVVRSAERDVERAQTALRVAEATKADGTSVTQTQRDALIANAQLTLQDAKTGSPKPSSHPIHATSPSPSATCKWPRRPRTRRASGWTRSTRAPTKRPSTPPSRPLTRLRRPPTTPRTN